MAVEVNKHKSRRTFDAEFKWLERAERIRTQQRHSKNKLYALHALHAPEVECIGKGKARKPYEFGVKSAVVVSHQHGLMLGARTLPGNPYDGHILSAVLEQATNLTQNLGLKLKHIVVDLGFRGVDADSPGKQIIHRGKYKSLSAKQKGWLRRRPAIEPAIGHLKSDHRMDRCWLQPALVAARHCPAGHRGSFFAPVAGSAVAATGRRDVIRCVWARVDCDYEQLDRKRGRQKIDFSSRRAGGFLKIEFCRAD